MGLAAAVACLFGSTASAGLVPALLPVVSEGDNYRYTYDVTLSSKNFLQPGDSFVLYDFAGFVPGSQDHPADFSFSKAAVTADHGRTNPNDNADIDNLVWTYTGATTLTGTTGLGEFSALSTLPEATGDIDFTSKTHIEDKNGVQIPFDAITSTKGPCGVPDPTPTPPGVPEPSSLLLLAAGLPLAWGVRYMKNRKPALVA